MKIKAADLIKALQGFKNILIFIQGSPDPDAIASSFAIKTICDSLKIKSQIIAQQKLSLPQNKLFVKKLNIPLRITEHILPSEKFDAYVIMDYQSTQIEGLRENIPCAVHIDHHEKIKGNVAPIFSIISQEVGATSTIMALLFKDMDTSREPIMTTEVATALVYGLQTDTDKYKHSGKLDYEALRYLSSKANNELINRLSGLPMSETTSIALEKAIANRIIYKDWLITGIGYLNASSRDSIAIIADFLLQREKVPVIFVFAIIKHNNSFKLTLDTSVRAEKNDIDLNAIIKGITTSGGARKYKGAFQIDIGFFDFFPDKEKLWEIINTTTIEAIKHQREKTAGIKVSSFIRKLSNHAEDMFSNRKNNKH